MSTGHCGKSDDSCHIVASCTRDEFILMYCISRVLLRYRHSWWCGIAAVLFGLWMKLYYIVPSWCWDGWPSSSRYIVLVCNQPSRSAQPSVLVVERLVANCYTPFTLLFYFALLTDWQQETSTRRWSSLQSRDFGSLHATLATLILNCDVSHAYTVGEVFAVLWVSLRPIPNVLVVCICILCIHMH